MIQSNLVRMVFFQFQLFQRTKHLMLLLIQKELLFYHLSLKPMNFPMDSFMRTMKIKRLNGIL